ncbi:GntR family transcriptional regulator [Bordetella holmesii]|uniref:UbiC transcription regulator-associated domain protein n=2 Tax=Bordetella holmesii TaxID=35814 RepID=A0A158M7R5_9BORD|nr:GntR family transcriptional regulator [Bordetella holmesii]AIT25837.1 deoR-like helix-turn-helix domain protein [Bordetella holmesii 44057]EWM41912.1 deoR-like helix-turn-helix domain protein [Bordetella holmesii 41130]EWM46406.1 deoR-like helix-turn-helix domain protein [Bordetella holmesii 35009]EWM50568.1 deoR-like helix-turn-helix domain protein [Bordetella holmesii 70147]AMD44955.1 GntR family transcriptional regulator [Bordetella holmesii H558]
MANPSMPQTHASEVLSRSKLPLYLQLAAEFRRNIAQGVWLPDQQIPSLEELMAHYRVARMTLRNALGILEEEGYIRRGRGKGTFVRSDLPGVTELQIPSNWEETVALSDLLGTESITDGKDAIASLPELGMAFGGHYAQAYRHLCRLHVKEGVPYCFSEVYLADDLFKQHKAAFLKAAAASVIARIPGLAIRQARQKITIADAGIQSARALNLNVGDSVAEVRRYACDDTRLIYFARLEFPTKFVKLEFDLC